MDVIQNGGIGGELDTGVASCQNSLSLMILMGWLFSVSHLMRHALYLIISGLYLYINIK
jgi:hypothetical protein